MELFGVRIKFACKDVALIKEWRQVQNLVKVDQFKTEDEARRFIAFVSPALRVHLEVYDYQRNIPQS